MTLMFVRYFTHLVLRGQVRSAVRWLTERCSNRGVLLPSSVVDDSCKTALDVLKAKHPDPGLSHEESFLDCEVLPVLSDVDITSAHVGTVVKKISSGRVQVALLPFNGRMFYSVLVVLVKRLETLLLNLQEGCQKHCGVE